MQPNRVVVPVVAAGSVPDDVRARLGERQVVFQFGCRLAATRAIPVDHGSPARRRAPNPVLGPEVIEIAVETLRLNDEQAIITLRKQLAKAVELDLSVSDNIRS